MTYYRLYPNTFHNTINKNVSHSNDNIDNLNQSSFHKLLVSVGGILEQNHCQLLLTFCIAA